MEGRENNQLSAHLAFPALNVTRVVAEIEPACGVGAGHTWRRDIRYPCICVYGSVSAVREFWPFRVIFFQKVERSCGQTVKDRFDFSIDLGQLCL